MLVIAAWTKYVVEERIVASGVISMVNILIWYFVLGTIIEDIHNIYIVLLYAMGCAVGTMLSGAISKMIKNRRAISKDEITTLAVE